MAADILEAEAPDILKPDACESCIVWNGFLIWLYLRHARQEWTR